LTPRLVTVFEKVLSPPEEQLETETRESLKNLVRVLANGNQALFQGHPALLNAVGLA
jgi:importin-4